MLEGDQRNSPRYQVFGTINGNLLMKYAGEARSYRLLGRLSKEEKTQHRDNERLKKPGNENIWSWKNIASE